MLSPVLTPDGRRGVPSPSLDHLPSAGGTSAEACTLPRQPVKPGHLGCGDRLCPILEGPQISHVTQRGPVTPNTHSLLFKMTGSRKDRVQASVCERVCARVHQPSCDLMRNTAGACIRQMFRIP